MEGQLDARLSLPRNTILGESYRIDRVIGSGGFGMTYAAEDVNLGTTVAIKEYYPDEFGARNSRMRVGPRSERHVRPLNGAERAFLRRLARSLVSVTRASCASRACLRRSPQPTW